MLVKDNLRRCASRGPKGVGQGAHLHASWKGQSVGPATMAKPTPATIDICDRTRQVQDGILSALSLMGCAAAPADRLTDIETLLPDGKSIAALKLGDFDNLTGLEELHLYDNQLRALPAGIAGRAIVARQPAGNAACLAAAETRIAAQATRLDAHQATIKALRAAIEGATVERQRMDAKRRDADAAHDEHLDAIEENIPPRRLRLWLPPSADE